MDSHTSVHGHQFNLLCYHSGIYGSDGQSEWQCFELVSPVLDVESHVLPGLFLYWYREVGILEIYRGKPTLLAGGGSDGFQCLQFLFILHIFKGHAIPPSRS